MTPEQRTFRFSVADPRRVGDQATITRLARPDEVG